MVLLEKKVYDYALSTDRMTRLNFTNVLEGLKPQSVRRPGVEDTVIHRRAIVGTVTTFELLAAKFQESSKDEKVALVSPFVAGEVEGMKHMLHRQYLAIYFLLVQHVPNIISQEL